MGLVSIPSRLVIGLDWGNAGFLSHTTGSLGKDQNHFWLFRHCSAKDIVFLLIDECVRYFSRPCKTNDWNQFDDLYITYIQSIEIQNRMVCKKPTPLAY